MFDVEHQPVGHHIGQHVGAAIAEKRQRNARDGHDPYIHADVFKYMEQRHAYHAHNNIFAEIILGFHGQIQRAEYQRKIKQYQ